MWPGEVTNELGRIGKANNVRSLTERGEYDRRYRRPLRQTYNDPGTEFKRHLLSRQELGGDGAGRH